MALAILCIYQTLVSLWPNEMYDLAILRLTAKDLRRVISSLVVASWTS
jgi:hypothetical protein